MSCHALHTDLEREVVRRTEELSRANEELRSQIAEREQRERALRESEERYEALIETAADPMYYVDLSTGRITMANADLVEQSGYTREELVGDPLHQADPQGALAFNPRAPQRCSHGRKPNGAVRGRILSQKRGDTSDRGERCHSD